MRIVTFGDFPADVCVSDRARGDAKFVARKNFLTNQTAQPNHAFLWLDTFRPSHGAGCFSLAATLEPVALGLQFLQFFF